MLLTLLAPIVVEVALRFGPAEYFALMVFAFVTVAAVLGSSTVRGLTMLFLGLLLGLVGIDDQTGQMRFAFGVPELLDGIDVVVLAVGLFAVGEALVRRGLPEPAGKKRSSRCRGSMLMSREDWRRSWPAWLRATFIGFPFGTIPAGGAEIPTFLSYALEKKLSKYPEEFGKGAIEGVAGPEAANNASSAGVLVPLLTLGHPDIRDGGHPARGVPELRPTAGPAAVPDAGDAGVGADRQHVYRQHPAADPQPAADRAVGEGADRSRSRCFMAAFWCSPRWALTACISRSSTWSRCMCSGCWAS